MRWKPVQSASQGELAMQKLLEAERKLCSAVGLIRGEMRDELKG